MLEIINLLRWILLDLFRSRSSLEGEVIALRQQLNVLRRSAPKGPALKAFDRLIFMLLYRLTPTVLDAVTIVRPETIVRWHRAGFRTFWRWKSSEEKLERLKQLGADDTINYKAVTEWGLEAKPLTGGRGLIT